MRLVPPFAVLLLAILAASQAYPQTAPAVTIDWDDWGVPHVKSDSLEGAGYGMGWAQMEARGESVAQTYLTARGEAAACFGEAAYPADLRIHQLNAPRRAADWLKAQDDESLALNRGFVAGMNGWLAAHPDQKGALACLGEVRQTDPLAALQVILHLGVVAFSADQQLASWREKRGSNAYAVAPARTRDGRPLLLINPHSPWQVPYLVFEEHVSAPGLEAYGATYPGLPLPVMGFTRDHGWAFTFNDVDGVDLYDLTLRPGGYLLDGQTRPFVTRSQTIRVKLASGQIEARTATLLESAQGPVLEIGDGRAVAVRIAGLDRPGLTAQIIAMWRAGSLADFKAALGRQQMPITNVIYANAQGEIFYLFNGLSPKRARGDRAYWAGIVDGTDSALIWTDYVAMADLPQVANPDSGALQNANDGPGYTAWPSAIDPRMLDPMLTDNLATPRGRRSLRQLTTSGPLDLEGLDTLRASSVMDLAEQARGPLADAARASGDPQLMRLGAILAAWDGSARPDSRGSVLFADWAYRMRRAGVAAIEPSPAPPSPLSIAATLADPTRALSILQESAKGLTTRFGRPDVTWGEVYRIRAAGLDLPSPVGRDELGAFNAGHYGRATGSGPDAGTFTLESASTFIAEVAFGPDGPEARGLLTYGNSDSPEAPGVQAQLRLFSASKTRPIAFTAQEVAKASRRRETLQP
ncbi:MAG: hypothetical protein GC145_08965 [Caulobacter sp.]|nr:hypothetical protein [Caulobacter sp.]